MKQKIYSTIIVAMLIACIIAAWRFNRSQSSDSAVAGDVVTLALVNTAETFNPPKHLTAKDIAVGITTFSLRQESSVTAIRNTWGSAFPIIHFFSATVDKNLNISFASNDPHKARASKEELSALHTLYKLYPHVSWYYKADDDAFVNEKALLDLASHFDPSEYWYIGSQLEYRRPDKTKQKYCAGGVGYLVSNALMRLIHSHLLDPIESCCSDVQMGLIVQKALHKSDVESICHDVNTPANAIKSHFTDSPYIFGAGINFLTTRFNSSLKGVAVTDEISSTLRSYVGFHYVTPMQQYVLWALYIKDVYNAETTTHGKNPVLSSTFGDKGSLADPTFDWDGICGENGYKCVISFGLYGSSPRYTTGAIRNAMLLDTIYPGWTARFYYDVNTVPASILMELRAYNRVELIPYNYTGGIAGMFARFLVASDSTVDRYIVRDSDSRLNLREKAAVDEWIESGYSIHILRDHPAHARAINGGMWGGVNGALRNISQLIATFKEGMASYGQDQDFLCKLVYPIVQYDQMAHDSCSCKAFPNSFSFPTRRINGEHVGMVFSENDEPRSFDTSVFYSNWTAPMACRRFPQYIKG